jgi:DNA-binding CsgD family transcriptional regulator
MTGLATRTLDRMPDVGAAHPTSYLVAFVLASLAVGGVEFHFADFEHGTHLLVLLAVVVGIAVLRGPWPAGAGLAVGGAGAGLTSLSTQEPPDHPDTLLQLAMYFLVGAALIVLVWAARETRRRGMLVGAAVPAPAIPVAHREPLTGREREILRLAARGISVDAMARILFVSPNTVKTHLTHVYAKLGARGRSDAIRRAIHLQELTVDDICPHLSSSPRGMPDDELVPW